MLIVMIVDDPQDRT